MLALQQVMRLFWEKGIENTSYSDIVVATGLSRRALYRVWPDKQTLIREASIFYCERELAPLVSALDKGGSAGLAEFWQRSEVAFRRPGWKGCLLFRAAATQKGSETATAKLLNDYVGGLSMRFSRAVAEGQRGGEIATAINANIAGWQSVSILALISAFGAQSGYDERVARLVATARKSCGL